MREGREGFKGKKAGYNRGSCTDFNREWRVESGEWRVESGEWRVESGEWRVGAQRKRRRRQKKRGPFRAGEAERPLKVKGGLGKPE